VGVAVGAVGLEFFWAERVGKSGAARAQERGDAGLIQRPPLVEIVVISAGQDIENAVVVRGGGDGDRANVVSRWRSRRSVSG
ncbi:hypothetical protein, partial [Treponema endosymbiont of Eucomonympha sp.]|uniref:hypothetical protein n=1 Tax=Treponema endosymbiont of Eucomonympha sp. TaxID=1580831 RepID=UPI00164EED55